MDPAMMMCAAGTLRRATRSITRVYDHRLAAAGLTTTQFSILRALERSERPTPLTALARDLVFERTSLYRALEPLARDRLVAFSPGRGRAKCVALTAHGKRRVARAMPLWTAAQNAFVERFGRSSWTALAAQLVTVVNVAHAIPNEES